MDDELTCPNRGRDKCSGCNGKTKCKAIGWPPGEGPTDFSSEANKQAVTAYLTGVNPFLLQAATGGAPEGEPGGEPAGEPGGEPAGEPAEAPSGVQYQTLEQKCNYHRDEEEDEENSMNALQRELREMEAEKEAAAFKAAALAFASSD